MKVQWTTSDSHKVVGIMSAELMQHLMLLYNTVRK